MKQGKAEGREHKSNKRLHKKDYEQNTKSGKVHLLAGIQARDE